MYSSVLLDGIEWKFDSQGYAPVWFIGIFRMYYFFLTVQSLVFCHLFHILIYLVFVLIIKELKSIFAKN